MNNRILSFITFFILISCNQKELSKEEKLVVDRIKMELRKSMNFEPGQELRYKNEEIVWLDTFTTIDYTSLLEIENQRIFERYPDVGRPPE